MLVFKNYIFTMSRPASIVLCSMLFQTPSFLVLSQSLIGLLHHPVLLLQCNVSPPALSPQSKFPSKAHPPLNIAPHFLPLH